MPKGYPNKKPAEGGAVGVGESVREPIKDMLASGDEKSFIESLPSETSSDDSGSFEEKKPTRKPRRSKEEMARSRGEVNSAPVDKRLERARQKQGGLGISSMVSAGFAMSGKALNSEEDEDLGDQFYLISNKIGGNSDSWLFIVIYTVALIARLIMVRTELGEEVREWMGKKFQPKEEKEEHGNDSKDSNKTANL